MHLDLHLHTTCSDGQTPPAALAAAARRAGLHAIAVTDHDTTAGLATVRAAAAATGGPHVITGIELSCDRDGTDLHLLGYGMVADHPVLQALTARIAARRRARVGEIVAKLTALGVRLTVEDVEVPPGNAAVGRPHVAQALLRRGVVSSIQEAFGRFLADGGPAHVPSRGPDVAEGIAAVREAGGCAVWAHPSLEDARHFPRLAALGLEGVEALRPAVEPSVSIVLEQAAKSAGLCITGGSDWHGTPRPALGAWYVTEKHVAGFLARIGFADPGGPVAARQSRGATRP